MQAVLKVRRRINVGITSGLKLKCRSDLHQTADAGQRNRARVKKVQNRRGHIPCSENIFNVVKPEVRMAIRAVQIVRKIGTDDFFLLKIIMMETMATSWMEMKKISPQVLCGKFCDAFKDTWTGILCSSCRPKRTSMMQALEFATQSSRLHRTCFWQTWRSEVLSLK